MTSSSAFRRLGLAITVLAALQALRGQAKAADDGRISGMVQDAGGKPVAGADVWLVTTTRGEAEIYDHARSEASGRFRLTVPGRWLGAHPASRQEIGVVAYQPTTGLAVAGYSRVSVPGRSEIVLEAKTPGQATLRILGPAGEPVARAKVAATMLLCDAIYTELTSGPGSGPNLKETPNGPVLGKMTIPLPAELSRRFKAETDQDGRATILGVALEDIAAVNIETSEYGTQISQVGSLPASNDQSGPTLPETISLAAVGKLSVRLAADGKARRHVSAVVVNSYPPNEGPEPQTIFTYGRARVVPDEQGRFDVSALAAGTLSLIVTPANDSPLRAKLPPESARQVKAGRQTDLEIPLVRGVRARGVVRERGSKRPLAGVEVSVGNYGMNTEQATTDDEGQFTCLTRPGQVVAWPAVVPANYAMPSSGAYSDSRVTVPEGAAEFEFPPIELTPLGATRGVVVAEDGSPAAGAKLRARWFSLDSSNGQSLPTDASFEADEQGAFKLVAVDPEQELVVEARSPAGFGRVRLKLTTLDDVQIKLPIVAADLVALRGRAIDTAGKPLAGAAIEIWRMPQVLEGQVATAEPVAFDGKAAVVTGDDGQFETPRELDRQSAYQARLALPGREPAATPWFGAAWENKTAFGDLVVRRVATLAGRVVDRQGRPVPEAPVFQSGDAAKRLLTTTDAEGRFRLAGAAADPTFVFVSKPGFRFFGQMVGGDDDALELAVTRSDEGVERPGNTLPRRLAKEERAALARRVLAPCLEEGVSSDEGETYGILESLAAADPAALLERLEKAPPAEPFVIGFLKRSAANALLADDLDEALAVAESIADPMFRSMAYLDAADSLGDDERQRKLELLGQASVVARQIGEPAMKAIQLGQTAERLLDAGQREQATSLLREGEAIAKQLPLGAFGGYARGAFAEELAQIDLPAALELMKDLSDINEFDRHHGNAAHELAAIDPAAAERLLGMLHSSEETRRIYEPRESWGVRVCYRMAAVDLPRARRLADSFANPFLKAQAYGVMAQAIGRRQPEAAVKLIEQAFALLEKLVSERERLGMGDAKNPNRDHFCYYLFSASSLAGSLLPNVESVDPGLVPEYLWRAVSFRLPRLGGEEALSGADRSNSALAMTLARYDREVAAAILNPIRTRQPTLLGSRDAGLRAFVLVDPKGAVEAIQEAPGEKPDCRMRAELAQLLVLEGKPLWHKLQNVLALWSIDEEDL
jgi:protocatechuate 3,4-dioxygenase beta subunit